MRREIEVMGSRTLRLVGVRGQTLWNGMICLIQYFCPLTVLLSVLCQTHELLYWGRELWGSRQLMLLLAWCLRAPVWQNSCEQLEQDPSTGNCLRKRNSTCQSTLCFCIYFSFSSFVALLDHQRYSEFLLPRVEFFRLWLGNFAIPLCIVRQVQECRVSVTPVMCHCSSWEYLWCEGWHALVHSFLRYKSCFSHLRSFVSALQSSCSVYNLVASELSNNQDLVKDFIEVFLNKRDESSYKTLLFNFWKLFEFLSHILFTNGGFLCSISTSIHWTCL